MGWGDGPATGDEPTQTSGTLYTGPITISETTVVRALAVDKDPTLGASNVDTSTYIFPTQAQLASQNLPRTIDFTDTNWFFTTAVDTGAETLTAQEVTDALVSLPSISLTAPQSSLWNSLTGIMKASQINPAISEEYSASLELIFPRSDNDFPNAATFTKFPGSFYREVQTDIMLGCSGRDELRGDNGQSIRKIDFGIAWKPGELQDYLFRGSSFGGQSEGKQYDRARLRGLGLDQWTAYIAGTDGTWDPAESVLFRDQMLQDFLHKANGNGIRGYFVHLYINSMYWGVYNLQERPDERWAAIYDNSDRAGYETSRNYDVFPVQRYSQLKTIASGTTDDAALAPYLDVEHFANFMVTGWRAGHFKAAAHDVRYWIVVDQAAEGPVRFFHYDLESSWRTSDRAHVGSSAEMITGGDDLVILFSDLMGFDSVKYAVWDAIWRLVGGPNAILSEANLVTAVNAWEAELGEAIKIESMRWGDERAVHPDPAVSSPTFTHATWTAAVSTLISNIQSVDEATLLTALNTAGHYPANNPPTLQIDGVDLDVSGVAISGSATVTATRGSLAEMRYTSNGQDPRLGSSSGVVINNVDATLDIPVSGSTILTVVGVATGPEYTAAYRVPLYATDLDTLTKCLKLTEIQYNADQPARASRYEFVELKNVCKEDLDVSGVSFVDGITYTFPMGYSIKAGKFAVVVLDLDVFSTQYPANAYPEAISSVAGVCARKLFNSGDWIEVADWSGATVFKLRYNDKKPWPTLPDGDGPTLVPTNKSPGAKDDPNDPTYWRASTNVHGSPGADDPNPLDLGALILILLGVFALCAATFLIGGYFLRKTNDGTMLSPEEAKAAQKAAKKARKEEKDPLEGTLA